MKFSDLPDLSAMRVEEVKDISLQLGIGCEFIDLSNGKYEYNHKRVVRYRLEKRESGEVLVCEITGFPTLDYGQENEE